LLRPTTIKFTNKTGAPSLAEVCEFRDIFNVLIQFLTKA